MAREAAERSGKEVGILGDLPGPKLRINDVEGEIVDLRPGSEVVFTTEPVLGTPERISVSYEGLPAAVTPGDEVYMADGRIRLRVTDCGAEEVRCSVEVGGPVSSHQGINLPGAEVQLPAAGRKDLEWVDFAVEHGIDLLAISFVRRAEDITPVERRVRTSGADIPVIAKIEKPQALERLGEIIDAADGVMVARGDLGVELGPEKVPLWQKRIIDETNRRGKIVITATQMLESMITQPRPTRAEASDVANAVLDGTDALMLSGETASGAHPIEAVRTMARIIVEIEKSARYLANLANPELQLVNSTHAIAHAAVTAARSMKLRTIVSVSDSGGAARLVSEYRPEANLICLTTNDVNFRRLALVWGVTPIMIGPAATTEELLDRVEATLIERNLASPGESVLITMAVPVGSGIQTNVLKIHQIQH
jgi:pyruvate kinase